jgi:hypothetical protein
MAGPKEATWSKQPPQHYKLNVDAAYFYMEQATSSTFF